MINEDTHKDVELNTEEPEIAPVWWYAKHARYSSNDLGAKPKTNEDIASL